MFFSIYTKYKQQIVPILSSSNTRYNLNGTCSKLNIVSTCKEGKKIKSINMSKIEEIDNVEIDSEGRFKYILINVKDPKTKEEKFIVRGSKDCPFHIDILEKFESKVEKLGLIPKCVGGGRILHEPKAKSILVYGYSQGFGRADHKVAEKLLKEKYKDYSDISWSNEGY